MENFLVFLVFAVGEITIGGTMRCQHCQVIGKEDCHGPSTECENEADFCMQAIEYDIVNGDKKMTVRKGCLNIKELCDNHIVLSAPGLSWSAYRKCCHRDDCNTGKIEMPKLNTTASGVICKSCFVDGSSDKCEEKDYEPLVCTGDQRQCIEFSGDVARPGGKEKKYYMSGCTTSGFCDLGVSVLVGVKIENPRYLRCPEELKISNKN